MMEMCAELMSDVSKRELHLIEIKLCADARPTQLENNLRFFALGS